MDFRKSAYAEQYRIRSSIPLTKARYLLLSIMLILAAVIAPAKAEPLALSLVTGNDYPPYTDIDLPHGGMATKLVRDAFENSGYSVEEISRLPWKRGYLLAEQGKYHATFPYGWTTERAELFYYSDPFLLAAVYAWSRAGKSNIMKKEEDLQGKVYCNPRGYGDFGLVLRLLDRNLLRRETSNSLQQCFKMLRAKRIDFVSVTRSNALKALSDAGMRLEEVQRSEFATDQSHHHLIVSKQLPRAQEIIDAFNTGLKKLKEDGRYDVLKEEFDWAEYNVFEHQRSPIF
ncbi:MAG: ABC transporter substrate-binding protein [Pseudomonas marincola]